MHFVRFFCCCMSSFLQLEARDPPVLVHQPEDLPEALRRRYGPPPLEVSQRGVAEATGVAPPSPIVLLALGASCRGGWFSFVRGGAGGGCCVVWAAGKGFAGGGAGFNDAAVICEARLLCFLLNPPPDTAATACPRHTTVVGLTPPPPPLPLSPPGLPAAARRGDVPPRFFKPLLPICSDACASKRLCRMLPVVFLISFVTFFYGLLGYVVYRHEP